VKRTAPSRVCPEKESPSELTMNDLYQELCRIVGESFVSNRPEEMFLYSRDTGTMEPRSPDLVVMPRTTEEVSRILTLANARRTPVVPMGAGLVLSGLTIPLRGGILLDLKRMDQILEVNERNRYAVVQPGVSEGKLQAYLVRHHPRLKHSMPDAPPAATIAGNVLIHGSGHMSQVYGFHSEMLNGLEVVLPTGEVCLIGTCAVSPHWVSRAPLPDLAGLFIGWHGTTGVITRLAIRLYPRPSQEDVMVFVTEDPEMIPDILFRITETEMAEDLTVLAGPKPDWMGGFQLTSISFTGNSDEEMVLKRRVIRKTLDEYIVRKEGGFMHLLPDMKKGFLETPQRIFTRFADVRKGGGFEYIGSIMPVDLLPKAYLQGVEIAERNRTTYVIMMRIIGRSHCMVCNFAYGFNRADEEDIQRAQKALREGNEAVLNLGGVPWKAEWPAQRLILQKLNPNTFQLMIRIRGLLDPNGIMNPGNWEKA
jgi:FAD/FMN-containing dehydrogenase